MNRLFGASKKPKEEPVNPNAPSLTETSQKVSVLISFSQLQFQLDERGKVVQAKVDECNKELMAVKKEMLTAKGMRKKTL